MTAHFPNATLPSATARGSLARDADGALCVLPGSVPVVFGCRVGELAEGLPEGLRAAFRDEIELFVEYLEGERERGASYLDPARNIASNSAEHSIAHHVDVPPSVVFSKRLASSGGWIEREERTLVVRDALGEKAAQRFRECETHGHVETRVASDGSLQARIRGSRCKSRACPHCSKRYADEAARGVERIASSMRWSSMLTLTIRHQAEDSLRDTLDRLNRAWDCLRRRAIWRRNVTGAVKLLEVTWKREAGWHPHIHALIDCRWMPREELLAQWQDITGDSQGVHVQRVKRASGAARYVAKYLTKSLRELPTRQLHEFLVTMRGVRIASTLGWCRQFPVLASPEALPDEGAPDSDWLPFDSVSGTFHRAREGDKTALRIIAALFGDDVACAAAPPRAPPSRPLPVMADLFA